MIECVGEEKAATLAHAICHHLAAHPEDIGDICPGMKLVTLPMNSTTRGKLMLDAAIKVRRADAKERRAKVVPFLKEILTREPEISIRQLATLLDQKGIKPMSSTKWSPASVQMILRQEKIRE